MQLYTSYAGMITSDFNLTQLQNAARRLISHGEVNTADSEIVSYLDIGPKLRIVIARTFI